VQSDFRIVPRELELFAKLTLFAVAVILSAAQAHASSESLAQIVRQRDSVLSRRCHPGFPGAGRVFFVSTRNGRDDRTELEAGDSATPWKTLKRLQRIELRAGDAIRLRAGDVFQGTLVVKSKATREMPITIGAYGAGARPKLTGRRLVDGWVHAGKGIWRADWQGAMPTGLKTDGRSWLTRYPREGWLHLDSVMGPKRFRQRDSLPKQVQRGLVCIQFVPWCFAYQWMSIENRTAVQLDRSPEFPNLPGLEPRRMVKGVNLAFLNLPDAVSQEGDWAWDREKRQLVLASLQRPQHVLVDAEDRGILIQDAEYVNLAGIECVGYRNSGVEIANSRNVDLNDLVMDSTGNYGIHVRSSSDLKIRSCHIAWAKDRGISLSGHDLSVDSTQIEHVGLDPLVLLPFVDDSVRVNSRNATLGNGIFSGDVNHVILRGNLIQDVGYNGIYFSGRNHYVEGNVIADFCQTLDDGGAIYTGGKGSQGSVIHKNFVGYLKTPAKKGWTHGIYLDDLSEGYLADSNVIWNVQLGVMLHNARQNRVIANEIHIPWRAGVYFQEDAPFADYSVENHIVGNQIDLMRTSKCGVEIRNQHGHAVGDFIDNSVLESMEGKKIGRDVVLNGISLDWIGLARKWARKDVNSAP